MKPVVVDTTLWVQWLRGRSRRSRQALQGRFLWMPSIVAAELSSGARSREAMQALTALLRPFERNRRCVVLNWQDHQLAGETLAQLSWLAGETLAQLSWPAGPKIGNALIAVSARKIGAELWTLNLEDFRPLGDQLRVTIVSPEG